MYKDITIKEESERQTAHIKEQQYSPACCKARLNKNNNQLPTLFIYFVIYLFVGEGQQMMSDLQQHEQQWTTGGEVAVCRLATKVSVQRPAAAVIWDEGEESCDWCRQALGGRKKKCINKWRDRA